MKSEVQAWGRSGGLRVRFIHSTRRACRYGEGAMRRIALVFASAAVVVVGSIAPGLAGTVSPHDIAGQESQDAADAADWFTLQRLAPNGAVDQNAFAAVAGQAASLPITPRTWTQRTNLPRAPRGDFAGSPPYIDPTSNLSNSGAGDRWGSGRMTALAAAPDGS